MAEHARDLQSAVGGPPQGMRRRRRGLLITLMASTDFVAILAAGLSAAWARFGTIFVGSVFENAASVLSFSLLSALTALLWTAVMAFSGLYDLDRVMWSATETGRVARALSMGVVALILATYVLKAPGLSRAWVLLTWILAVTFILLSRAVLALLIVLARRRGRLLYRTLIVGSNSESADIIRVLRDNSDAGLVPIGCLTSSAAERLELDYCSEAVPILGSARDITRVLAENPVDTLIIASSAFEHDVLARMIAELRGLDVDVHISSGLFEVLTSRVLVNEVAGVPLITVKGRPMSRSNTFVKRVFDLTFSTVGILLGIPLWLLIAAGIKLSSRGPILYGQRRVGRNGERFAMLKFRSMYADADARKTELLAANEASGPMFKLRDDPRVTPIGRWMRKFSIDEVPQLINVFIGDMSLVGPRPPLPEEVSRYTRQDWRRLEVTPGMTGLWQVSGRSSLTFDEMVRLDVFYIENWSVSLDLALIVRTVPAVLLARGAY